MMSQVGWTLIGLLAGWLILHAGPARAYDLRTHWEITGKAFDASQGVRTYLEAAGIRPTDTFTVEPRTHPDQLARFENTGTPRDWMIEGAIREDDYRQGCEPPENPPSPINRPVHHFFDVQRLGQGLTVPILGTIGFPAPDWALGIQGRDQNGFTLLDARDYQVQSLTAPTREARNRNTARLFRALGHVVHLLEDMAQPQHTRNDPHAGGCVAFGGGRSWYELYIEDRALGGRFRTRSEVAPPLVLGGYAPVSLPTYRDFFAEPNPGRRGLAHVSSRNFYSAGTNLGFTVPLCGGLTEPICDSAQYPEDRQERRNFSVRMLDGTVKSGDVTLYRRNVFDPLTGQTIANVPVSSRSVWDEHLEQRALLTTFTLNTLNYDAAADILLPRAVGYAAGLLDYFFRGRLEAYFEDNFDPFETRLTIINRSDEAMSGTFELYYQTPDNTRHHLAGWNLSLNPGEKSPPLQIPFASLPPDERLVPYLVVFKGSLGSEPNDAVAATWVEGLYAVVLYFNAFQPGEQATSFRFRSTPELAEVQVLHGRFQQGVFPGGEEYLQVVCRNLTAVPQRTLVNRRVNDLLSQPLAGGGFETETAGFPGASIVEFEPPASIPDMFAWRIPSNPPRVRRVIRPLTVLDFGPPFSVGANTSADLTGVRCFGVRLDGVFGEATVTGFLVPQ